MTGPKLSFPECRRHDWPGQPIETSVAMKKELIISHKSQHYMRIWPPKQLNIDIGQSFNINGSIKSLKKNYTSTLHLEFSPHNPIFFLRTSLNTIVALQKKKMKNSVHAHKCDTNSYWIVCLHRPLLKYGKFVWNCFGWRHQLSCEYISVRKHFSNVCSPRPQVGLFPYAHNWKFRPRPQLWHKVLLN